MGAALASGADAIVAGGLTAVTAANTNWNVMSRIRRGAAVRSTGRPRESIYSTGQKRTGRGHASGGFDAESAALWSG